MFDDKLLLIEQSTSCCVWLTGGCFQRCRCVYPVSTLTLYTPWCWTSSRYTATVSRRRNGWQRAGQSHGSHHESMYIATRRPTDNTGWTAWSLSIDLNSLTTFSLTMDTWAILSRFVASIVNTTKAHTDRLRDRGHRFSTRDFNTIAHRSIDSSSCSVAAGRLLGHPSWCLQ